MIIPEIILVAIIPGYIPVDESTNNEELSIIATQRGIQDISNLKKLFL